MWVEEIGGVQGQPQPSLIRTEPTFAVEEGGGVRARAPGVQGTPVEVCAMSCGEMER
jgi:hypothetical protein